MTCTEVQEYLASDGGAGINRTHDSARISEHIASCSNCNCLIEKQKELAKCLDLLRDSAPAVPGSLDGSVLARYRIYMSGKSRPAVVASLGSQVSLSGAFRWVAALTFAVIVAYGTILTVVPDQRSAARRVIAERHRKVSPLPVLAVRPEMSAARQTVRKKPKSDAAVAKHSDTVLSAAQAGASFPAGFRSLMYCDQLSCAGAMDVIRVQIPSPVLAMSSISTKANGVVTADVLVGSDGIARAIRVVE